MPDQKGTAMTRFPALPAALSSLLVLAPLGGCTQGDVLAPAAGPLRDVALNQTVTLAPGEEALLQGSSLRVRFLEVRQDSRCPSTLTCVWAGRVQASLLVSHAGALHSVVLGLWEPDATAVVVGGYRVELQDVLPHPETETPIPAEDYRAVLTITAAQGGGG